MSESTTEVNTVTPDYPGLPVDELRKLCRERGLERNNPLELGKAQLVEFLTTGSYTPKASNPLDAAKIDPFRRTETATRAPQRLKPQSGRLPRA